MAKGYTVFTKDMKKDYTILAPNMLTIHFKLILQVFKNHGYHVDLLQTQGPRIAETGLKYVHNDACYPAVLVIGQFIDALQSGNYDPHKVALIMFQTGGGCRASNYIYLIRKALERAGYGYVPVISFSLMGLEKHPGFKLTLPILHQLVYAVMFGDLMMSLINQCKPFEIHRGDSETLADSLIPKIIAAMDGEGALLKKAKRMWREIILAFASIPMKKEPKVLVGVVGEIYIKFSPLGNNNLEDFLVNEGAEVVIPGFLDFLLFSLYDNISDFRLYRLKKKRYPLIMLIYRFLTKIQNELIKLIKENGRFTPPTPFKHTVSLADGYIGTGAKMGEGWLLTAEMLELYDRGVKNVVCAQPFGCLPNHICGKGMMKPLKDKNPDINIVAVDYDPGATRVNQENRLKLMLANAKSAAGSFQSPDQNSK